VLTLDGVEALMRSRRLSADLIAIDGAPLAGKSTLSLRLSDELGFGLMGIDDFVRPEADWRGAQPAYPFPFFRNAEFAHAIRALREEGRCSYHPYDWERGIVSSEPRQVVRDKPIVIEGTSVLDPALVGLYDVKLFVESDPGTLWDARSARDGESWTQHWRELFVPSADLYAATRPRERADFLVKGRGL
jgi:uridine kinase